MHLSGHSHLYERFTRTVGGKQIPYLVAGMGGFYNLIGLKPANNRPAAPTVPSKGTDAVGNPLSFDVYNDNTFGFLRMTVSPASITGEFITVDPATGNTGSGDSFTVDLGAGTVSTGIAAKGAAPAKGGSAKPVGKKPKGGGKKKKK